MSALTRWLDETQAEVKMADGHILTVVPVRVADCLIAGAIPVPVLEEMAALEAAKAAQLGTPPAGLPKPTNGELTPERKLAELKTAKGMEDIYVRLSIVAFDNEAVEMTPEAVRRLGAVDPVAYAEVLAIASREVVAAEGKG